MFTILYIWKCFRIYCFPPICLIHLIEDLYLDRITRGSSDWRCSYLVSIWNLRCILAMWFDHVLSFHLFNWKVQSFRQQLNDESSPQLWTLLESQYWLVNQYPKLTKISNVNQNLWELVIIWFDCPEHWVSTLLTVRFIGITYLNNYSWRYGAIVIVNFKGHVIDLS